MELAIEYMIRKKIVRQLLTVPCSLFLTEHGTSKKTVVTISRTYNGFHSVRHWHVSSSVPEKSLPKSAKYRVKSEELFDHPAVVVPDHSLMKYRCAPVPFEMNSYREPMPRNVFDFYYDHYVQSPNHQQEKMEWLWREFVKCYAPEFLSSSSYISWAEEQREYISSHKQDVWEYWLKWSRFMLRFNGVPGELSFSGDYKLG